MSYSDYKISEEIVNDYPFYALIMAAFRQADTDNLVKLQTVFPDLWKELQRRYKTPHGGLFEDAKGVLPWKEGDELPETAIRRLRDEE